MDRRSFLQGAAALASTSALGRTVRAAGAPASERLRAGFVGVGGRAFTLLDNYSAQPDVEVVAIADIDPSHIPPAMKLLGDRSLKAPATHGDFRRVVDDPSIQVVVVGTPDHWHAIPTIMA